MSYVIPDKDALLTASFKRLSRFILPPTLPALLNICILHYHTTINRSECIETYADMCSYQVGRMDNDTFTNRAASVQFWLPQKCLLLFLWPFLWLHFWHICQFLSHVFCYAASPVHAIRNRYSILISVKTLPLWDNGFAVTVKHFHTEFCYDAETGIPVHATGRHGTDHLRRSQLGVDNVINIPSPVATAHQRPASFMTRIMLCWQETTQASGYPSGVTGTVIKWQEST